MSETFGKASVIFVPSHWYLYLTTGAYFVHELASQYNVVLIVDTSFRENDVFQRLCQSAGVSNVYYLENYNIVKQHYVYKKVFSKILRKYRPKAILQHNFKYVKNMYLFYLSKAFDEKIANIVYLNGMQILEPEKEILLYLQDELSKSIANKYGISKGIVNAFLALRTTLNKYINFYFMPMFVLKRFPYSFSRKYNYHRKKDRCYFDFFCVYHKIEKEKLNEIVDIKEPVFQIMSPMIKSHEVCDSIIYGEVHEEPNILIAPSLLGFGCFAAEKKKLDSWIKYIVTLREKVPDYKCVFKFHPRTSLNNDIILIKSYLIEKCPFLDIVESSNAVERLILSSKIIVSDVSTILWWALSKSSKLVVSIDIDKFPGSSGLKWYPGVIHIEDFRQLKLLNIEDELNQLDNRMAASEKPAISLLQLLEKECK